MTRPTDNDAVRNAIEALTWFPATRDAVSGRVTPPRRKTHVRVRDIDAALARVTPPESTQP